MFKKKYLYNCFLLLIPILLWNAIFTSYLPRGYNSEPFPNEIPQWLEYFENFLRIFVFVLPAFMVLSFKTRKEKTGLVLFVIGTTVYLLSWLAPMFFPASTWSTSALGFMAPAHTTIIWLFGIGLIGNRSFLNIPTISKIYIGISFLFVFIHSYHSYIIFISL